MKQRLDKVLGLNGEAPKTTVEQIKAKAFDAPKKVTEPDLHEEDEDLNYFSKLAEDE